MFQTILLCYNGTPEGRRALREGAEIAKRNNAKAHLLAVIVPVFSSGEIVSEELIERTQSDYHAVLEEGIAKLRAEGIQVEGHMATGRPEDIIPACAREVGADLIVVGHRNQSTLARWWHGSVGGFLVDHAPCSILISVQSPSETK